MLPENTPNEDTLLINDLYTNKNTYNPPFQTWLYIFLLKQCILFTDSNHSKRLSVLFVFLSCARQGIMTSLSCSFFSWTLSSGTLFSLFSGSLEGALLGRVALFSSEYTPFGRVGALKRHQYVNTTQLVVGGILE